MIRGPGRRKRVVERRTSRRPWVPFAPDEVFRIGRTRVRVVEIRERIERRTDVVEHVTEVFTAAVRVPRGGPESRANVVRMPAGDASVVAQFLRFHVLIRVYGGDADAWLARIRASGGDDGDLRFVHWVRSRLRHDPSLLASIRKMVDATPFWRAAGGVM